MSTLAMRYLMGTGLSLSLIHKDILLLRNMELKLPLVYATIFYYTNTKHLNSHCITIYRTKSSMETFQTESLIINHGDIQRT